MAIIYVLEHAHGVNNAGSGAIETIPVTTNCTAGNTLVLVFATRDTSILGCSVSDTRGNAWTIDVGPLNMGNNFVLIASTRQNVAPLLNGQSVFVTMGTAPGACRGWMLEEFSGLLSTAGYADQNAHNENIGPVTSGDSGTTNNLLQPDELVVAGFCLDVVSGFTHDPSFLDFTGGAFINMSGSFNKCIAAQYRIVSSTATQVCSISWLTGGTIQGMIQTYRMAGAPPPTIATEIRRPIVRVFA